MFCKYIITFLFFLTSINLFAFPKVKEYGTLVITKKIELKGREVKLPKGVTLNFQGGSICNGTLVGNETKISGKTIHIFDKLDIKGVWIVPKISTRMFCDLSEDNSLRKVIALTNKKIRNEVTIESGLYNFEFKKNEESGLLLEDNTVLILKGTLTITPNHFVNYQIIRTFGKNIVIKGGGKIIGDKSKHIGNKGQWGMGIDVYKSNNVVIKELSISNCWGDCIYVGYKSKKIIVSNCLLFGSRRQGISVTDAIGVTIRNCKIFNISGTKPGFAIDVEPNKNCIVTNVLIENNILYSCNGGIELNGHATNAIVKDVKVSHCIIQNMKEKYTVQCYNCQNISFDNCKLDVLPKYILFKDCNNARKKKITLKK